MKEEQDHARDIMEIRSMMERSSKFVWLSGWAGIMAGIYALAGAYIAYTVFNFNSAEAGYTSITAGPLPASLLSLILLAIGIFVLAACTAIFFTYQRATKRGEKLWNATSRRLLANMAVPFFVGGLLILILIDKGLLGFIAPFTLVFYGLALYNISKLTYSEVRVLGITEIVLGLIAAYFVEYGLLCWAAGFGIVHIIYGIYIHFKYEK